MEVSYLSAGKQLPSTNKLIPLTQFYDDSGIIYVGGRLKNSILPESQKHPILLPKTDHVGNLIISDYHLKLLHAGPQLLQASLREKFWILSARDAVRRVVRRCIPCFRNRPRFAEQIMGDLPESRVCPCSVFQRNGIDFASPFLIRSSKGRGIGSTKCYICVFVCLATKAVHPEVVSDLTSKAFIACLKRFVACRGKPSEIFCDQGTNFYGASRDLKKEFLQLMKEDAIHQFLITREKDLLYKPTPVSKRSRRQETIQTSDDMDTDANLTDTDYVTDLAPEEYESLLEADFQQAATNPLTRPKASHHSTGPMPMLMVL
ncbi:integrase catalytic domain-containing protein [Trichonephila inaurata madagascariensis]|uniref:Integrase catalytic domain-containing protein n=1 Tax=Trichonephila inaurata madagascariensis TaxID=2747483 RepID=A0A8X6I3S4_9ARAC|nr:integrase catalytic domain-containing protein [Trichonephila inaurata madagascariensis]